jgi:hypothetical protein
MISLEGDKVGFDTLTLKIEQLFTRTTEEPFHVLEAWNTM